MTEEAKKDLGGGLGPERCALHRSARGLAVAGILVGGIFTALALPLLPRSGPGILFGGALLGLVALITLVVFLRQPRQAQVGERGIRLLPFVGGSRSFLFEEVTEARLRRAPLGQQPLILRLSLKEGKPVSFSEAEYDGVSELIEVVREELGERFVDETPEGGAQG